jgi:hypothetical protein
VDQGDRDTGNTVHLHECRHFAIEVGAQLLVAVRCGDGNEQDAHDDRPQQHEGKKDEEGDEPSEDVRRLSASAAGRASRLSVSRCSRALDDVAALIAIGWSLTQCCHGATVLPRQRSVSEDPSERRSGHERPGEGERADDPEHRHDERLDIAGKIERSERQREAEEYGTLQHERGVGAAGHRAAHRSGSVHVPLSGGQYPNRPRDHEHGLDDRRDEGWHLPPAQKRLLVDAERPGG